MAVAAPTSTIDIEIPNGDAIPIEERDPSEVTHVETIQITPDYVKIYNPAFDVTPAELVTAIITEYGVASLYGKTIRQRVKELINISHPEFREELHASAKELGYC